MLVLTLTVFQNILNKDGRCLATFYPDYSIPGGADPYLNECLRKDDNNDTEKKKVRQNLNCYLRQHNTALLLINEVFNQSIQKNLNAHIKRELMIEGL